MTSDAAASRQMSASERMADVNQQIESVSADRESASGSEKGALTRRLARLTAQRDELQPLVEQEAVEAFREAGAEIAQGIAQVEDVADEHPAEPAQPEFPTPPVACKSPEEASDKSNSWVDAIAKTTKDKGERPLIRFAETSRPDADAPLPGEPGEWVATKSWLAVRKTCAAAILTRAEKKGASAIHVARTLDGAVLPNIPSGNMLVAFRALAEGPLGGRR